MKAIIPVAGAGTHLRPLTYTQPKPLIPVAGKPIMAFILDKLLAAGIEEFIFVIGHLGEKISNYVDEAYPGLKRTYVYQEERLGTGHAVWSARDHLRGCEDLIIFLGDTIVEMDFDALLHSPTSCLAVKKVDNPRHFGIVEFDEEKHICNMVEKPRIPRSDMAMVGVYKIKEVDALLDAIDYNIRNDLKTDGEFPLTDAFQRMLEQGIPFSTLSVKNWYDCGRKESLLHTNALLLSQENYQALDVPEFDNAIIIHPVSIGSNCEITNAIIGPHVTVGNNVRIRDSIVEDSIIGHFTFLHDIVLKHSVIGNDSSIAGFRHSLNIGDNTEIDLSSP